MENSRRLDVLVGTVGFEPLSPMVSVGVHFSTHYHLCPQCSTIELPTHIVGKRGFEPPFQSHRSDLCFWGLCYLIRQRTNTLRLCSPLCIIPVQQLSRYTGQEGLSYN